MLRKYYWHSWFTMALALAVSTAWAEEKHAPKKDNCCDKGCCEKSCCDKGCCTAGDAQAGSCCKKGCCDKGCCAAGVVQPGSCCQKDCCEKHSSIADNILPGPCYPFCDLCLQWLDGAKHSPNPGLFAMAHHVGDLAGVLSRTTSEPEDCAVRNSCCSAKLEQGAEKLIDLIVRVIEPNTWECTGGQGKIRLNADKKFLVITDQSPQVHDKVGRLLWALQHCDDPPVPFVMAGPMPPPPAPLMPPNLIGQAACPFQAVSLPLPMPVASAPANGRSQEYELQLTFVATDGDKVHHQALPRCRVIQNQNALVHFETQTEKGLETRHVECLLGPCNEGKTCLELSVETGIQTGDESDGIAREQRVALHGQIGLGDEQHRIPLDTDDGAKAQKWLEFTVRKVESEQLPPPKPCAADKVTQCPACPVTTTSAVVSHPALPAAEIVPCAATVPVSESEQAWKVQAAEEDGKSLLQVVNEGKHKLECESLQLAMKDGFVLQLHAGQIAGGFETSRVDVSVSCVGPAPDAAKDACVSADAACVSVPASMDRVVFEGGMRLWSYKTRKVVFEVHDGTAILNLKNGTITYHPQKGSAP
jgi:hypothetical protein